MLATDGEPKTEAQRQAGRARERCKTGRGVWAHKRRMADAEGVIGELKNQGNLDRARCRGTPLFHVQLLVGCTAINMKRLTTHAGEAASGRAAGLARGEVIALEAVGTSAQGSFGARIAAAGAVSAHQRAGGHAGTTIWSFGVSLN